MTAEDDDKAAGGGTLEVADGVGDRAATGAMPAQLAKRVCGRVRFEEVAVTPASSACVLAGSFRRFPPPSLNPL